MDLRIQTEPKENLFETTTVVLVVERPEAIAPSEAISDLMRRFRSRDTRPEVKLRSALHRRGLRFRLHRSVPGAPRRTIDIAFPSERVAVFVDGCFWHSCPRHGKTPDRNGAWWQDKLAANTTRDRDTDQLLTQAGWEVLRYWEHEDPIDVANEVVRAVRSRRREPPDLGANAVDP